MQRIGCRLKIFSNIAPQSTDRVAQIIGKEEQCIECLMEIMDLIKTVCILLQHTFSFQEYYKLHFLQTPIKGPVHNYDPHNFDDMYADEYGGYGSGMNGSGGAGSSSSTATSFRSDGTGGRGNKQIN
jgi:heterogeneous nuclear ribonucleoprotein K